MTTLTFEGWFSNPSDNGSLGGTSIALDTDLFPTAPVKGDLVFALSAVP